MKLYILIFALVFVPYEIMAQIIPETGILTNTQLIEFEKSTGTSFFIKNKDEEYLITAKHIFQNKIQHGEYANIYMEKGAIKEWFTVQVYFHSEPNVDIAVIKMKEKFCYIQPYELSEKVVLGQDCRFLGFPLQQKFHTSMKQGKVAFIKRALFSAFMIIDNYEVTLLDGSNNPGFSGGPVIFQEMESGKNFIYGVVSGYFQQFNKIETKSTPVMIPENSNIMVCFGANYINEIIESINN